MNPDTFHDLLDRATQDPPPPPAPGNELGVGRIRLRRRRAATAVAGVLSTVVVVGGGLAVTGDASPDRAEDPVATAPRAGDDQALLDSCRHGNQSDRATSAMFGTGSPVVKNVVRTDYQIVAALESADGKYWAECWVHLLSAEFSSGMTVYPSDPGAQSKGVESLGTSYSLGPGCGLVDDDLDPSCHTWFLEWVDRLPAEVGSVRFRLADGTSVTAAAQDGYVVLNTLHDIGEAVTYDAQDGIDVGVPIRSIEYLDGSGAPIARQGPGHADGLPRLSAYRSLRGAPID
jgi:hypothetical protein